MLDRTESELEGSPLQVTNIEAVLSRVNRRMDELAGCRYFRLCRSGALTHAQLVRVLEQLYCFSTLFERILTRRLGALTSRSPEGLVLLARRHLREELGHVELFRRSLLRNGRTTEQIKQLAPSAHTKALFGYLLATLEYEHELVTNVAIMQVMELIGLHFFECSFSAMEQLGVEASALAAHAEDDRSHSRQGFDLCSAMDRQTLADAMRVIDDLFRLMAFVLEDWITLVDPARDEAEPARAAALQPAHEAVPSSELRSRGANGARAAEDAPAALLARAGGL